ncbi:MAG: aspartate--tRNA ligase [Candidatus Pacebacteria bacterium]|nr:aspartate--tRNA ligase [Candidatus Paceibacterota bacterium]
MRTLIADIVKNEGKKVELMGWVNVRRDHGKIIFIDLRDRSGVCQVVFLSKPQELYTTATTLRSEWVAKITGTVNKRPANMVNKEITTGEYEVLAEEVVVLGEAKTPPFDLQTDGYDVGEDVRMKYRYLDLRRARLNKNLKLRSEGLRLITDFLTDNGFINVETPILGKSTPEGARDYLVPSRLHAGKFYALPQSPQQYKQLLMVAGMERYFQIARCFRDEDTRGDRQPEFTQLDLELSFTNEEEIMDLMENLLIYLAEKLVPEKKIMKKPFPRLTYAEAMKKYESDKPDLRKDKENNKELAFCWVTDFPLFEYSETEKRLMAKHHPFTSPNEDDLNKLEKKSEEVRARAYDVALNGFEIGGGSIRIHKPELQQKMFKALGLSDETVKNQFGHLIEAFESGAPPHGGIAIGLDRLFALLFGEPNIREVIAFPKTGDGSDLMMDAPSEADKKQLKELNIEIIKKNKK